MDNLVVVSKPGDWPGDDVPGARVIAARDYLTGPEFVQLRRARVFNLCRQYRYQSVGYYVSLLAEARGHRVLPSVLTMQDLRTPAIVRHAGDELADLIRRGLAPIQSDHFQLSIYFGRNLARRHDRLAAALFRQFPAPLLRASFVKAKTGDWVLRDLSAIPASAIPETHLAFAREAAVDYFTSRPRQTKKAAQARFDLAILVDFDDPTCPSDEKAIRKFEKAAEALRIATWRIGRNDYGRLAEFDGLFIRATTAVNHYTYRFSRRAAAEGLVVIDDPVSILRCTNKVYLAELLARNGLPVPRTLVLHRDSLDSALSALGAPVILKQPDSSSSLGVVKAVSFEEARSKALGLFEHSDLLIAQEFLPTDYDWRIGILDGSPLYAARYYMAKQHWQIVKWGASERETEYGRFDVLPVEQAPAEGVALALKAANLIGNGLYGVDLKQVDDRWVVIEVNDNPSLEDRVEDQALGDELYRRVMTVFLKRMEAVRGT